jgi:hypothetical protein
MLSSHTPDSSGQSPRKALSRHPRGQSIVEVMVGSIVLVPIILAILDLAVVVIGGNICNDLSKQAARAAANASQASDAAASVLDIQNNFHASGTYKNLTLKLDRYDGTPDGSTTVVCSVTIVLPVPVPFLGVAPTMDIKTQATEAIVGIAPPPPS